jgi:hypothetical protein
MPECLALIFQQIPGLPEAVALDIAHAMSRKHDRSVREALERFRDAIQLNYDRVQKYCTDKKTH